MAILEEVDAFIEEWESDAPYIIAHTSGSTGKPKEIRLEKMIVEESARRTIEFFNLDRTSHLHLCLSPSYIAGKMMIVRALLSGARLTAEEPSNRPCVSLPKSDRISLLAVVPSQIDYLCEHTNELPRIDQMIVGGSPLTLKQREKLAFSGIRSWETYGMTETASHIALSELKVHPEPFRTLPGISVGSDERGCLVIKGKGFGTIVTNDMTEILDHNNFRILGRVDDVIISGGLKIHPSEVEGMIEPIVRGFFGDVRFCVVGAPDEKWGSVPVLIIERGEELSEISESSELSELSEISEISESSELVSGMRNRCGAVKAPRRIFSIKKMPLTDSGKIRRSSFAQSFVSEKFGSYKKK